jgi:hypothetical protein
MSALRPVPETYAAWRHCIEVDCSIALTPTFVTARLAARGDERDPHTRRFVAHWGDAHRRRVLGWLEAAKAAMPTG